MSILTFQATGKYIRPTSYRQIVETESALRLSSEQQSLVSRRLAQVDSSGTP